MKKMIACFAAALLVACSAPTSVQWFQGSFDEAISTAQSSDKPILLDFYSDT